MINRILCALFMIPIVCNAQLLKLPVEFQNWLDSEGMKHATVALEISRLDADGQSRMIYCLDNERSVQPASNMKLLTTAAALCLLAPSYTIPTEVYYSGKVENGILNGNIILRGHGNALLSSSRSLFPKESFANAVVSSLKKLGINCINGKIIGDGSLFKQSPISTEWTWEDMGNHYAQSISGLNYMDNAYSIELNTSKKGSKPIVKSIEPEVDNLVIDNQLLPLDYSFDSAYVYGAPFQNTRTILGAVPHKHPVFKIKGDVPDPAQFAASQIKKFLQNSGIIVKGDAVSLEQSKSLNYNDYQKLYTHKSENLSFAVKQTNVFSVNLLAEMILRQLSLNYGDGSETDGINSIMNFWRSKGLDLSGVRMFDGCGLAPADRVTAHFMVQLLEIMNDNETFVQSLPVAGKSGTVYSFLKGTKLEGKAYLKTGTTKSVIAYSGYIDGTDGNRYAVSFIVNNHSCMSSTVRKNIEKMLLLLIP